jgi:hypothetical protein
MDAKRVCGFLSALLVLLCLSGTAPAANATINATVNQTFLGASLRYAQCKTSLTTAFLGDLASASPKLSQLSRYSATLQLYSAQMSMIAISGNVTAFRAYLGNKYDHELNAIAGNVSSQVKAANLSSNVTSHLRMEYNSISATYANCTLLSIKQYAQQEIGMYDQRISADQNSASALAAKGINVSSLTQMLQHAQSQIVSPLSAVTSQAKSASQVMQALDSYCLFDGCKSGTNFHLDARFELQSLTLVLNYLQASKNITSTALAAAQACLNNASTTLQQVGTGPYSGSESKNIFGNLTAASNAMAKARQQDAFAATKRSALNVISGYVKEISTYQAAIARLASTGENVSALNQTLLQADSQIITPLQDAVNASVNASQLGSAFQSYCLDNACKNGTNYHLGVRMQIGEASAYLAYLQLKANSTKLITVNQTALSSAESVLDEAASLLGSVGAAQMTRGQASQFQTYADEFQAALRQAFRARPAAIARVNNVSVNARGVPAAPKSPSGRTAHPAGTSIASNIPANAASASSAASPD